MVALGYLSYASYRARLSFFVHQSRISGRSGVVPLSAPVVVVAFRLLDRTPRPVGFFLGIYGVLYGGFRIWLDTLHMQPARFYGAAAGVLVGLLGWSVMLVLEKSRAATAVPLNASA